MSEIDLTVALSIPTEEIWNEFFVIILLLLYIGPYPVRFDGSMGMILLSPPIDYRHNSNI